MTADFEIRHGDALALLRTVPDESVDLIATDPPYFRVKDAAWDNAWENSGAFLAWIGELADEWRRVLRPNGSLYCFASPQMASRVEAVIAERFRVLNHVVWVKDSGYHMRASRDAQRSYFPQTERVVFAEQFAANGSPSAGTGFAAAEARTWATVFEPLRRYLADERDRAGVTNREVDAHLGRNGMAGHYFGRSQWSLPTAEVYGQLRALFRARGGPDLLARSFEELRAEFEELRRPFDLGTADGQRPSTDVWAFPIVKTRSRVRHECEKPVAMLEHIVRTSSRPGDLVLDCFAGSASTGEAALRSGRRFLGFELDEAWIERGRARLGAVAAQPDLFTA